MAAREIPVVAPWSAYTLEMRWKHIKAHLAWNVAHGQPPRPGHIANTYGGGLITKADVQEELRSQCELGGGK